MIERRALLAAAGGLAASPLPGRAVRAQETWPTKPIRWVFPYTPGGSADALARAVADFARERLGQPLILDGRPGANTQLGAEIVAHAPKDGYTLLYAGWPTVSINVIMNRSAPYKTADFQPITPFFRTPLCLAVAPNSPIRDLGGFVEAARRAGSLGYGTSGIGASSHLLMERLRKLTGARLENVPYRGEAPALTDVIAGHLPAFCGSVSTALPQQRGGLARIIGHSAPERLAVLPDVPTFAESGFPDMVFTYWHGAMAPAGTPRPIVERLHGVFAAAMESPAVRARLSEDFTPYTLTPDAFGALIREEIAAWTPIIRDNNLMVD